MFEIIRFLFENSVYAAVIFCIVMVARLVLCRSAKAFSYILWITVFLRLVCPASFHSIFSIIPNVNLSQTIQTIVNDQVGGAELDNYPLENPILNSSLTNNEQGESSSTISVSESGGSSPFAIEEKITLGKPSNNLWVVLFSLWGTGFLLILVWYSIEWFRLYEKTKMATLISFRRYGSIFESDQISSAFVFGILKPKILVPTWLVGKRYEFILSHELIHLRRFDHIIKPVAFFITALYWFNPIVWISFHLMCKDMEMSCDEAVLSKHGSTERISYSKMLLEFVDDKKLFLEPAFGEASIKARIKNALLYRKRSITSVICATVATLLVVIICFGNSTKITQPTDLSDTDLVEENRRECCYKTIRYDFYQSEEEFLNIHNSAESTTPQDNRIRISFGENENTVTIEKLFDLLDWNQYELVETLPESQAMEGLFLRVEFIYENGEFDGVTLDNQGNMELCLARKSGEQYEKQMELYLEGKEQGFVGIHEPDSICVEAYKYRAPASIYYEVAKLLNSLPGESYYVTE